MAEEEEQQIEVPVAANRLPTNLLSFLPLVTKRRKKRRIW